MAEQKNPNPPKVWRVVLVLSLAFNIAIIGLVAGVGMRSIGGKPPQNFEFGLGPIGQALTQDQRREVGKRLRQNGEARRAGRGMKEMVDMLVAALRAPTFDPAAVDAALSASADRASDLQTVAREAFIQELSNMTDAERQDFATRLEEMSPRRRRN